MRRNRLAALVLLAFPSILAAGEPIRLANTPALSPDGSTLAFSWAGEIWTVPSEGGMAKPLTRNPSRDLQPRFSPDGKEIAFNSDREGSMQVFAMPADGSDTPKQITFHTAGSMLQGYFPDGQSLLVTGVRDHYWYGAGRFFKVNREQRAAEELLFDDYGAEGSLSPDGKKLLFTREGTQWWRKGYRGSQSAQVWLFDLPTRTFTKLLEPEAAPCSRSGSPTARGFITWP